MRTPLLREKLPIGLEDSVTVTIVSLADGDRGKARAIWSLVHGMVDLELANRFPKDADLDQMWDEDKKEVEITRWRRRLCHPYPIYLSTARKKD